MVNYSEGKIYKLYCFDDEGNEMMYIGSTASSIAKRLNVHKTKTGCTSKLLFETGYKVCVELLEEYPCENRNQLERREGYWIRKLPCINRNIAGRTVEEYREDNKEHIKEKQKEWYETNKEHIKEVQKEWYEANKEHRKEKVKEWQEANKDHVKEYYEDNKEHIKEKQKEWREANKEKIKEWYETHKDYNKDYYQANKEKLLERYSQKVKCDVCNCKLSKSSFLRHTTSKKHQKNLNTKRT
jgi:hypothetical protein